jgi:ADP-heptose:LPS heptosyltransferase
VTDTPSVRIAVLESQESLGIAIWKFPFYRALRRAYPGCEITLVVSKKTMTTTSLAGLMPPFVDRVIADAAIEKPMARACRNLRALPRFDLVFDARTKVARVIQAKLCVRTRDFVSMLPGFWLTSRRRKRVERPLHWVGRLMAMLETATGRPADWRGRVPLSDAAHAAAAQLLPPGPAYVGLCPGAHGTDKIWPLDKFVSAAKDFSARGWRPVVMIGPNETEMVAALKAELPDALFPEVDRGDGHPEVKGPALALALGERLTAAVANCTGIGHVLANAGTPLVSLFGPTDPRRFLPWTDRVVALRAQDFGGGAAMDAIPVDAVVAAAERLVAEAERAVPEAQRSASPRAVEALAKAG